MRGKPFLMWSNTVFLNFYWATKPICLILNPPISRLISLKILFHPGDVVPLGVRPSGAPPLPPLRVVRVDGAPGVPAPGVVEREDAAGARVGAGHGHASWKKSFFAA